MGFLIIYFVLLFSKYAVLLFKPFMHKGVSYGNFYVFTN